MTVPSRQTLVALLFVSASALPAQTPAAPASPARKPPPAAAPGSSATPLPKAPPRPVVPYINHNLVFLDPGHGGPDAGAHLSDNLLEKDITFALADRIRNLLAGNNLTVVLAREADQAAPPAPPADDDQPAPAGPTTPTPDQRAGVANHAHPVACILLHATSAGNGVHIITSPLQPPDTTYELTPLPARAVAWNTAQTDSIAQSTRLANEIGAAIARSNLPVHLSRASVKPIDSLMCPAVAIELAPLASGPTRVSDTAYQQRVAEAVATALLFWRGHADPPVPPQQVVVPLDTPRSSAGAQP